MHWIIGGWHIAVHCLNDRWDWRVDDLVHGLDPITLEGRDLPDQGAALVKALDIVSAFEAINLTASHAHWRAETRDTLETPSRWILDPDTLVFEDDVPIEWLDLPDDRDADDAQA